MNRKKLVSLRTLTGFYLVLTASTVAADAVLWLDSINARADTVVSVPLNISGSPTSAGFNVAIDFPDDASVSSVTTGALLDGSFSLSNQTDALQNLRILGYSSTGSFSGSGVLANLQLQIGAGVLPGFYAMEVSATNPDPTVNSRYALSNSDGSVSLPVGATNANLFVYSYASDFDGDQLPDNWEMNNGLDHLLATGDEGANGDIDSDGTSNLDEYRTGSDPNNALSGPEGANGVSYVYFRDHFDDDQYLDRWFVGVVDPAANYSLFEESITGPDGVQTILDTDIAKPAVVNDCDNLFLQSIATVDMADGVLIGKLHPFGSGTTSIGLNKNGDLATRIELQFDTDQAPYFTLRSFENGVEIANAGLNTISYADQDIEVRLAKNGSNYGVFVNGVLQATSLSNFTLGDTELQPFVAAESCFADTAALDTYIESIELLRDSDADGMADLHEDRNLDGVQSANESNLFVQDSDGDGVLDGADNCVLTANSSQFDGDNDGFGNLCDADFVNDCIVNFLDLGYFKTVIFTPDPVGDINADGMVNFLDLGQLKILFFGIPGPSGTVSTCD